MKYRGREIKFLRTVQAECNISLMCEDGMSSNFKKLLMGSDGIVLPNMASIIHYLNEGYENAMHFENPEYEANPLTAEELMFMDSETFMKLWEEAMLAYYGETQTIEVEQSKKKTKKKTKETSD